MLSALEHIYSHGIVHRDIAPQNILSCDGADFAHLYLIDFGLARRRLSVFVSSRSTARYCSCPDMRGGL